MSNAARLKNINIGRLIRQRVDELHLPYAEFARQINCARTSLYHIFNSKSIDVERLIVISEVLQYDFLSEVYLKDTATTPAEGCTETPHLVIPFRNGHIDWSDVPPALMEMLRADLLSKT